MVAVPHRRAVDVAAVRMRLPHRRCRRGGPPRRGCRHERPAQRGLGHGARGVTVLPAQLGGSGASIDLAAAPISSGACRMPQMVIAVMPPSGSRCLPTTGSEAAPTLIASRRSDGLAVISQRSRVVIVGPGYRTSGRAVIGRLYTRHLG